MRIAIYLKSRYLAPCYVHPVICVIWIKAVLFCEGTKEVPPILDVFPIPLWAVLCFPYLHGWRLYQYTDCHSGAIPVTRVDLDSRCSLQISSHLRSFLSLYRAGNFGFFVAARKPRCLKLTISPGFGAHLVEKSSVPSVPTNRTPFGLYGQLDRERRRKTYNSQSH